MKIVFLGDHDWANTSNRVVRAINRTGGANYARCITRYAHPFEYDEDVVIERDGWAIAENAMASADWVIGAGDANYKTMPDLMSRLKVPPSARIGMRHSGTELRNNPVACATQDAALKASRVFVPMDLLTTYPNQDIVRPFVQPQEHIASCPVAPSPDGVIRVCHTPSERRTKGTKHVVQAMIGLDPRAVNFEIIEDRPFAEVHEMRRTHHVLVDNMHPGYGNFGASACEAMACGLSVVSNISHVIVNHPLIPTPPIIHVETEDQLSHTIALMTRYSVTRNASDCIEWASKYLSDSFTASYWGECLK